jgi:hypothetical protein
VVDAVEPEIRELLSEFPRMPVSVIAEIVGWERGMSVVRDRVEELRPLFLPPDPCQRTCYRPGELAEFDLWQPDTEIPLFRPGGQAVGGGGGGRVLPADRRPPGPL